MSGLSQYALTNAEDLFLKTASTDFDKNQGLTEHQEKRLETLYKEKSSLIPGKKPDLRSSNQSSPKKTRSRLRRVNIS